MHLADKRHTHGDSLARIHRKATFGDYLRITSTALTSLG